MSKLFESITINDLSIKNRLVMPPMCMYSAKEGHVSDFHVTHYGARAIGGVGLIIVEATGVASCGRITDDCLGIYEDSHTEGLARIASVIKTYGAAAAIQLGHAGRKCTAGVPEILAPSAIAYDGKYKVPREMGQADIESVVQEFKSAAGRAAQAGFDMVEIHGAHGYLLSTFLSPLSNKRVDEYGGSHENRARLVGKVVKAVKEVFPGPVCLRVSSEDFLPEGNRPADIAMMINSVKAHGIDIVDVSAASVAPAKFPVYPGYQVKFAEEIRELTSLPVMTGGLLTSPFQMEEIVANGRADMVYVGRELLRNPQFPLWAAKKLGVDQVWPKQYERARYA